MWVIFEGLDKTGKTTLEWEFLKATNFKHVVIDRGPMGYMTFDKVMGRDTKTGNNEFIDQARRIMKPANNAIVVYCYADESVIIERIEKSDGDKHHDINPYEDNEYKKLQKMYETNVSRYYKPERTVWLNTGEMSIKQCVDVIIDVVESTKYVETLMSGV